jgi:hypothetical protein
MSDNYDTVQYGTKDGEIKFGHINADGTISAFIVRSGADPNHYVNMVSEGEAHLKNGTINRCTGAFQVKAGDNVVSDNKQENIAIYLEAVEGDIVINAPNGAVRIIGKDIQLSATGSDDRGNINIDAKEKIILKSRVTTINSSAAITLVSNRQIDIIGKVFLNFYGGMIDCADSATKKNGSKNGSKNETNNKQ